MKKNNNNNNSDNQSDYCRALHCLHLCTYDHFPLPSHLSVCMWGFIFFCDSEDKCSAWQMFPHAFRIFFFNLLRESFGAWLQSMGAWMSYGMPAPQKGLEERVKEEVSPKNMLIVKTYHITVQRSQIPISY